MNRCCRGLLFLGLFVCSGSLWADAVDGAGVGALGGALAGSLAGPGKNRLENSAIGAVVGGLLGYAIGNEAQKQGHGVMHRTLDAGHLNDTITWVNPANQVTYQITPQPIHRHHRHGHYCRNVHIQAIRNGHRERLSGLACRDRHGYWWLVEYQPLLVQPMAPPRQTVTVTPTPSAPVIVTPPAVAYGPTLYQRDARRRHERYHYRDDFR
ncbi:MAG: glycine zipper 2TM domain-containing protein [Magnetococcales bacterium]|nr:glycine zipper 2TM domain-containing protein [Magnetococcales bacterium]